MKKALSTAIAAIMLCISSICEGQTFTGTFSSAKLQIVLEEVQKQTGYSFIYDYSDIENSSDVTAEFNKATVTDVLDKVLDSNLKYSISGRIVSISRGQRVSVQDKKPAAKAVTVSGTVISSADNQPLIGAGIIIDNSSNGTVTDINGNFSITIPASAEIVTFSCLGYQSKEIHAKDAILMKLVSLNEETTLIEDAVVVGFGIQKKESVVGAVQAIRPKELSYPSSNLTTAFAGKIAGVISTQTSGEPGADGANFWIRGISTFGTNTSPLIVMDGVEINATMLNSIAPETIESFSVLKDATATALYGSRGANGVMIITTKNGHIYI